LTLARGRKQSGEHPKKARFLPGVHGAGVSRGIDQEKQNGAQIKSPDIGEGETSHPKDETKYAQHFTKRIKEDITGSPARYGQTVVLTMSQQFFRGYDKCPADDNCGANQADGNKGKGVKQGVGGVGAGLMEEELSTRGVDNDAGEHSDLHYANQPNCRLRQHIGGFE
jgi:hypothetical protein